MSDRFKILMIDNLTVRKMNLQVGENIIQNNIDPDVENGPEFNQAAKIYVSPEYAISITPCEGVLCYIRSHGSIRWKIVKPNWTVALNVKDTCLLSENKIWFKVIPAMDTVNENKSPKRKLEKLINDGLPHKRRCSIANEENEPSNRLLCNDSGVPNLIMTNCVDSIDEVNDCNSRVHNSVNCSENCSDIDTDEMQPKIETDSIQQNNEQINLALDNNNQGTSGEEILNDFIFNGNNDSNPQTSQQFVDLDTTNTNSDNSNQTFSAKTQNIPKQKCKYGNTCYRLSAEHKKLYSHPGDSDFDLPDNRPECIFGEKCYRKNPQHKIDYKHTKNKRKRNQINSTPVSLEDMSDVEITEEESVDESEYEPSFIDDESLEELESDFE